MSKEKTFEENLVALEKIVRQLESGDVPLEEALQSFQTGIALTKELQGTLTKAEDTLTKIMTENGPADFDLGQVKEQA
ncbi:exodeoxyribonuclease VII small subunit [Enterococcus nangangensis]